MKKNKREIFEYVLEERDLGTIKKCLDYVYHRLTNHKCGISGIVNLEEVERLRKEIDSEYKKEKAIEWINIDVNDWPTHLAEINKILDKVMEKFENDKKHGREKNKVNMRPFSKRFLGSHLLYEKHNKNYCDCSYCKNVGKYSARGSLGFWVPVDKSFNSWWVIFYVGKEFNKYFRFTLPFFKK